MGEHRSGVRATGDPVDCGLHPRCRDPDLRFDAPDSHYWNHVRRWREKGWTIAMHGLHHACHDDPPGCRALIPFHRRGEFAGLPLDLQMMRSQIVTMDAIPAPKPYGFVDWASKKVY
jgi:Uncharacterized protein conserved in bacteria (DUF2334)